MRGVPDVIGKKLSYISCIPKQVARVSFEKAGTAPQLDYVEVEGLQSKTVFRSEYGMWMYKPEESDSGTYK